MIESICLAEPALRLEVSAADLRGRWGFDRPKLLAKLFRYFVIDLAEAVGVEPVEPVHCDTGNLHASAEHVVYAFFDAVMVTSDYPASWRLGGLIAGSAIIHADHDIAGLEGAHLPVSGASGRGIQ